MIPIIGTSAARGGGAASPRIGHRPAGTRLPGSPAHPSRVALLAALLLAGIPAGCASDAPPTQPALAVVLVVDQLTPDLLERYDPLFEGGFRRLLDDGHRFPDAVHDHAITFTSPGHASPVTGVAPARHGIVSNSWREWREGEWQTVSSVADPDTRLVGGDGPGSSPHRLLADGLPDWLLAERPGARVVSLSGKSTASVLMGGREGTAPPDERARPPGDTAPPDPPTHVYWFSVSAEGFVTSTHYRDELPPWVAEFNEGVPETYGPENGCWRDEVPEEHAHLSRRDTVDYEADGVHTHFPHCVDQEPYRDTAHFLSRTPGLDAATLGLARSAVDALGLGSGEVPDYLALALSAADRVGHAFGPWSREQMDNLLRLDRELGAFLEFLDDRVGRGRYLIALTSDHGVLPLPEYLEERGDYGLRMTGGELSAAFGDAAEETGAGPLEPEEIGRIVRASGAGGEGSNAGGSGATEARSRLAERLQEIEWIEDAMTLELLAIDSPADSFVELYRRSFHPERLPTRLALYGVEARLREGVLVRGEGTTHGVPYMHDRHVPLLFYGPGIEPGGTPAGGRTVDLAPTVAHRLGLPVPPDLDGRPLLP